jgi:sugar/nucleoside kinase (ribokinase family)
MAEAISEMGCETVVIKSGAQGQLVWDSRQNRRWTVPAYPSRVRDIQGVGDAYCGGFLAGLGETGDVLEAALRGSVSASLAIEGTGALYPLDSHPRLAEARLEFLRKMVKTA